MRILIVDDSTLFRKVIGDALVGVPGIEVVGSAANGRIALAKIAELHPDVLLLDIEMPELDGIQVLEALREEKTLPGAIIVSTATEASPSRIAKALQLGAFDFVLKPTTESLERNCELLREELLPKIRVLSEQLRWERSAACDKHAKAIAEPTVCETFPAFAPPEIIAIGASTGGPTALFELLPKLPADLPVPIVVVQHMPPGFTRSLAQDLDRASSLHVVEAMGGEQLRAGVVYLAPGGRQMKVAPLAGDTIICVTDDPPEKSCRPSVDFLYRSLAHHYGPNVLAIIMTGMGDDGVLGCRLLKRKGAQIVAQDESSSVAYSMPRQVVDAELADVICPLSRMPDVILRAVGVPRRPVDGDRKGVLCG